MSSHPVDNKPNLEHARSDFAVGIAWRSSRVRHVPEVSHDGGVWSSYALPHEGWPDDRWRGARDDATGLHPAGTGAPLVLLHALGLSRRTWDHVVPELARHFDVIAVDLPGFGDRHRFLRDVEPTPATLAAAVDKLLERARHHRPAGRREFARRMGRARARRHPPGRLADAALPGRAVAGADARYALASLQASRWLTRHAGGVLSRLVARGPDVPSSWARPTAGPPG